MIVRVQTAAPAGDADRGVRVDEAPAVDVAVAGLRVLFLVSAHNSLSQRVWTELTALGHEVTVPVVSCARGDGGSSRRASPSDRSRACVRQPFLRINGQSTSSGWLLLLDHWGILPVWCSWDAPAGLVDAC